MINKKACIWGICYLNNYNEQCDGMLACLLFDLGLFISILDMIHLRDNIFSLGSEGR